MKSCAYCGRENADSATSCRECGTDEFVLPKSQVAEARMIAPLERNSAPVISKFDLESLTERELDYLKTPLPSDHYLATSTEEELVEILAKPSAWCGFDVAHAKQLILDRGIDLGRIEEKRAEHLERLRLGRPAPRKLIVYGWVFSFLGGLVGLAIAWSLTSMKEQTPHGEFFTYDEKSRAIGEAMLKLAAVMVAFGLILQVISLSH